MSDTRIKAGQFHGVVGHGTDGYFLMTNADGSMSWSEASTGPSVTSVAYPGDDTAADPAGGQTVVLTGTNFGSSMTVSIGGTTAPSVAHDSSTQLTITTPAKAAGDYDIVVTNTVTGVSGTFVNGISYNGVPAWTTSAGSLGTFNSNTTISTITLQATEPDGGTITFSITNGTLPTGLSLSGANIDGTTTTESSTTLYSFTIEAIDDENQSTPRNFSITVNSALVNTEVFDIVTYTGTGGTYSIGDGVEASVTINSGTANYARGSVSHSTGKRYFEVEYISAVGGANTLMVGIINTAYVESWTNAQTKMYYAGNGNKYTGGSGTSYGATYAPGDIIGVAYDGTERTVTFYKNNVSQGTAFTGLITNYPSYYAAIGSGLNSEKAQFRFTTSEFTYTPPSGYSEWGTSTVSAHSGTVNSAVAAQPIDFQPDLVWIKNRETDYHHRLIDSVRGLSTDGLLFSNLTNAADDLPTSNDTFTSFDSNGFTLGSGIGLNQSNNDYVAWCWKAGGTAVSGTSSHYTNCEISANPDAGFSIVNFTIPTGLIPTTASYNHGLNAAPKLIITKPYNGNYSTTHWYSWAEPITTSKYLKLDDTDAELSGTVFSSVDSSTVRYRFASNNTGSTSDVITYNFTDIDGYQKVGSYSGLNSTDVDVVTDFKPRFVLIKRYNGTGGWAIFDSQRNGDEPTYQMLLANSSNAESNYSNVYGVHFKSDRFTVKGYTGGNDTINITGGSYIYLAIA